MKKKRFTFEECLLIAKKYDKRKLFHDKERTCYNFAKQNGWFSEITKHMGKENRIKINKEEVYEKAKQFNTKMDFKKNESSLYSWAVKHKILDDACQHMTVVGDKYNRCIYVYEFPNKICYVGLTYNLDNRHKQHTNPKIYSAVREYCEGNNLIIPIPKQLTDYIDSKKASKEEGVWLRKYVKDGWIILNRRKTGSLGGRQTNIKITKSYCKKIAKQYINITEFAKKHDSLYRKIKLYGWSDFVFSHINFDKVKKEKNEKISKANKGKKRSKESINNNIEHQPNKKIVLQFSKEMEFIKEYRSIGEAAKATGNEKSRSDISKVCKGKRKYANGYIWMYK